MNQTKLETEIRRLLPADRKFWKNNGSDYHGAAPHQIRVGSDSTGFHVNFTKQQYYDHVAGEGGGFGKLAKALGIITEGYEPYAKPVPKSLAEYEANRNLPPDYLKNKGWTEGTHDNRPCIFIPTAGQTEKGERLYQVRYLDHQMPKYLWKTTVKKDSYGKALNPIYGLKEAIDLARQKKISFLVHCNGAISVEVAQYWGVPAFAVLGGEGNCDLRHIETITKATDLPIVIILDCDKAGRDAAQAALQMYGERAIAVNLDGVDGFDLDDFCRLWEDLALAEIQSLARKAEQTRPARTMEEAGNVIIAQLKGELPIEGRYIPMPFTRLHEFGGGCEVMIPGLMTGVLGASGYGKTAFWQSLAEMLLRQTRKWGIMVDAREFKPTDDFFRHLMRETNPAVSHSDIVKHLMWRQMAEETFYIDETEKAFARPMTNSQLEGVYAHHDSLKHRYSGLMEYAQEFGYIEDTLAYMLRRTKELRHAGHFLDLWIFDYLTLYKAKKESMEGSGEHIYNIILDLIKQTARKAGVHVLVLLQPNKQPSSEMTERNKLLEVTDINYAHPNYFNTIIGLNTLHGAKAQWVQADNKIAGGAWAVVPDPTSGKPIRDRAILHDGSVACIINVLKNTNGKPNGVKKMVGDFQRVRWLDKGWHTSDLRIPLENGK